MRRHIIFLTLLAFGCETDPDGGSSDAGASDAAPTDSFEARGSAEAIQWRGTREGPLHAAPNTAIELTIVGLDFGGHNADDGICLSRPTRVQVLPVEGEIIELDKAKASDLRIVPENMTWDMKMPNAPLEDGNYAIPKPGDTVI